MNTTVNNTKIKMGSDRNFGIIFSLIFLVIGLFPIIFENSIILWALLVSLILFIISIFFSKILKPLNLVWFKFGLLLGSVISPIIMMIIFFVVVMPTGLIMRVLGKDILRTKLNLDNKTYWIKREDKMQPMKNQF